MALPLPITDGMRSAVSARARRAAGVVGAGVATALIMSGCGGHGAASAGNSRIVDVTERDFAIVAPATLPAGEVTLRVHNEGPVGHELIVVRSTSARLPLRSDGLTVDEDGLERS